MIQSTKELCEKMLETPDLCGKFELVDKTIFWDLFDGFVIRISIEPPETLFDIETMLFGVFPDYITHWHPDEDEIYDQVCHIGLKGSVLVLRRNFFGTSVLYMGKEEHCPYSPQRKRLWGKIYYLKAK